MPMRLAVIGGGPKGVAVAAKAAALRDVGYDAPTVVIFEEASIGAAWDGSSGYTNGETLLCTPAAHDLGYPYDHLSHDPRVATIMARRFSWHEYLNSIPGAYQEWVSRGQRPPTHKAFAAYLRRAATQSGAVIRTGKVVQLSFDGGLSAWTVVLGDGTSHQFDGVVVTGSGPPLAALPGADARVLNGRDMWSNPTALLGTLISTREPRAVVIGSGGTAGAAAAWLVQHGGRRFPVVMVGRQPTIAVRAPTYFETRLLGNNVAWERLSTRQRKQFTQRINSGFLWTAVSDVLEACDDFAYEPGDAKNFVSGGSALELDVQTSSGVLRIPASLFVDCRGFDALWFARLFTGPAFDRWKARRNKPVGPHLALKGSFPYPRLHAPALGNRIGPGAGNLLALGWVSDRILKEYI
ncbi:MAG: hypothetical protein ACRYGP_33155 [Janthinobacterium lividum]